MKAASAASWIIPEWRRNVAAAYRFTRSSKHGWSGDGSVHAMMKKLRRRATLDLLHSTVHPTPENKFPVT